MSDEQTRPTQAEIIRHLELDRFSWSIFEGQYEEIVVEGADLSDMSERQHQLEFRKPIKFRRCIFSRWPFGQAVVHATAEFSGCKFTGDFQIGSLSGGSSGAVTFSACEFQQSCTIGHVSAELVLFDCIFSRGLLLQTSFPRAVALGGDRTKFKGKLTAVGVQFAADFELAWFTVEGTKGTKKATAAVDFSRATFEQKASVAGMRFTGPVSFNSAKFNGPTHFRQTVFEVAPAFHGADLNPETVFDPIDQFDAQFPDTKSDNAEKRYQTLKGLFGAQQALSEQLGFSRLEMKAHAKRLPWWRNTHRLYGWLADYGLSWNRPLLWLAVLTAVFSGVYWHFMKAGHLHTDAIMFSLANAFPFVGSIKEMLPKDMFDPAIRVAVASFSVLQSFASSLALFLIALGIRNRLRMK